MPFGLAALTFANPLALLALLALPAIWWLLRFTPPRPLVVRFPPFRLLRDLIAREEQPDKMPWWLLLLRLLLAALLILAVAGPSFNRGGTALSGPGPLLIVLDNGWASGKKWEERRDALDRLLADAEASATPVAFATTAAGGPRDDITLLPAAEIRRRIAAVEPQAVEQDRPALARRLATGFAKAEPLRVAWLADGIDDGTARNFAEELTRLAGGQARVEVLLPSGADTALALAAPALASGRLKIKALRVPQNGSRSEIVHLSALNGRNLASLELTFAGNAGHAEADIDLPIELRNEAARLEIAGGRSAGSVFLFDDRYRRKSVALLAGSNIEQAQPLLSPLYYVGRALQPTAEIEQAHDPADLVARMERGLSMIVLADIGTIPPELKDRLTQFIEGGGVLVRFAGPRLAAGADDLIPVELRTGGRSLGSALSWEEPQGLAPFAGGTPFAGLASDPSIKVTRQVLAEPSPDLAARTWATLQDGTPLVTASQQGDGLVVLFHVTANADWSNLPLSGLFVSMLERIVDLSRGAGAPKGAVPTGGEAFAPSRTLNGFGELTAPSVNAEPITAAEIGKLTASIRHPAGLYGGRSGQHAINIAPTGEALSPIAALPASVRLASYEPRAALVLAPALFFAALLALIADCAAMLVLSGMLRRLRPGRSAAALVALLALSLLPVASLHAQEQETLSPKERFAVQAASETRLAYVLTGNRQVDDISLSGLTGLGDILVQRTAVEPGTPVGIDIERDEIVFFPLLYWPVTPDMPAPSPETVAKLDAYMKHGGTIFFDTRDAEDGTAGMLGETTPAGRALRRILELLDIPRLEPVPPEHVLTKAFYLMQSFPGRYASGQLWVEASESGRGVPSNGSTGNADGVTTIIIGSNDYAAAWSTGTNGEPLYPAVPGGELQREMAFRVGINIVMYALTGNYKADQVHVPALLERLGQ